MRTVSGIGMILWFFGGICIAPAQCGWFEDFDGEDAPYGFTLLDRGGSLGSTLSLPTMKGETTFLNSHSAYLSEAWDRVSRSLDIKEGLCSVWFRDTGYTGPNANSIRLRSEEDGSMSGWPADFLTVELRGQQTGHGSADIMDYYINQPAPDFNAMGTYFGVDVATGERTPRRRDAWNEAVFYLSDGKTYVSVNNSFNTCVVETPLVAIELLNRSGWYLTRGGDPAIMLWDDICVMPLLRILTPEETGDWVSVDGAADIVISSSPTQDIVLLPDTKSVARFVKPDAGYRASWRVSQGMIEIWFWDPYLQDPGYKTEIGLENPSTGEFIQATAYSVLMNEVAASYYASTDKTGHGGSFSTPRSKGWHRVVFRKVNDQIRVSIDGVMADGDALMWNDPPANLEFYARSGNSNYPEGSAVWFSRAVFTGDETTSLPDWRWR